MRCTACERGTVIKDAVASAGVAFGHEIDGLPADVAEAYSEARRCMSVGALTGAELICRKILMHVAVDRAGPEEGRRSPPTSRRFKKAGTSRRR